VDHGKTALVRVLTGVDTDRWEEEKRRGITIDLGFAPLDLRDGLTASIVDVPGHEDFVRNMVAGATGVDVALLVVAADEGVMPQTEEHLAIVEFLGVASGVAAISKSDLVEPDWLDLVQSDVTDRLGRSPVAWEPPVVFSAQTGEGSDALLAALARAAERASVRATDDLFRMPVDRVFSVAGAGTVVTGSTWSGSIAVGDAVRVLPEDLAAKVRSIEVHGKQATRAIPGRRTALALPGLDRRTLRRGSVVVADDAWRATTAVDARITLLPGTKPLTQRSRIRFHLGTAEVLARVTPAAKEIASGTTGDARLRLEGPVVARWGDRGVIRSYSPVTTIGGCVVVDPWPPGRPRRPTALEERGQSRPGERVAAFVVREPRRGLAVDGLTVRLGLHPGNVTRAIEAAQTLDVVRVGERLVLQGVLDQVREATMRALERHHAEHPLEPGLSRQMARRVTGFPGLADHVHRLLASEGAVAIEGENIRLSSHRTKLTAEQEELAAELVAALKLAGYQGCTARELESGAAGGRAGPVLSFLVRQGTARRVGKDRYYDRQALARLADDLVDEVAKRGRATPSELRERTGLSRKFLIPVLEWLDQEGFTVREGDSRRLGPAARRPADA
jgi:selenocysteine-specific elongation factor